MYYYLMSNGAVIRTTSQLANGTEITKERYDEITASSQIDYEKMEKAQKYIKPPMSENEVTRMLISKQINTLEVDDNTALRMLSFYPEWTAGKSYPINFKVQKNNKLYRTLQAHTSQEGWEPENAASLWVQINETHTGTADDPIPYEGNMALENGKYYMQNYEIYFCNRDTINPVYNSLEELIGLYVIKED